MSRPRKLACLLALAAVTNACGLATENEAGVHHVPETKDRLSPQEMETLVAAPMDVVREKGLAAGETAFAKLLTETKDRYGADSVRVADLLTSFAIELYVEDSDPEGVHWAAARRYQGQAIPAYRVAFGPNHPEVALALNTYAELEWKRAPDDPPPEVEILLKEALRIRQKSLGTSNPETVATGLLIARIHSLPAVLKRDPARFAKAESYFRQAIAGALPGPEGDERSNKAAIQLELATLHARSGDPHVALVEVRKSLAISKDWEPRYRRCELVESRLDEFVELMSARGLSAEAKALQPKGRDSACDYTWRPSPAEMGVALLRKLFGDLPH